MGGGVGGLRRIDCERFTPRTTARLYCHQGLDTDTADTGHKLVTVTWLYTRLLY